jgi:hypothetical protein
MAKVKKEEPLMDADIYAGIQADIKQELIRATQGNGAFNSAHEGYAVLLEEVDELWDEVKLKRKLRDKTKMKAEAVQIAAMAIRFIHDICYSPTK